MTDPAPDSLAAPFYAAMREQILATRLPARYDTRILLHRVSRWVRPRRTALELLGGVSLVLAAVITVVVLALGATTSAPPAYAIARHADGSITITLNELTTGIPALNAKLRELGIPETVIPITSDCHSPDGSGPLVMHPDPLFEYNGSISTTYTPQASRQHPAAEGFHYVLAAKRLPNGKILGFIGALKAPIPSCLPYSSTPSNAP
jgi:hypothetical protein